MIAAPLSMAMAWPRVTSPVWKGAERAAVCVMHGSSICAAAPADLT
jgi:hypothetical protein